MSLEVIETQDLDACFAIRRDVFIVEQNVPEEIELDHYDEIARHILALKDGQPAGTARILMVDEAVKIGRIAVLKAHRGTGLGAALTLKALELGKAQGAKKAVLSAQLHAIGFYEKLGFVAHGPIYLDADIEHRDMDLSL